VRLLRTTKAVHRAHWFFSSTLLTTIAARLLASFFSLSLSLSLSLAHSRSLFFSTHTQVFDNNQLD